MNRDWRNGLIALAVLIVGIGGFFVYQQYFQTEPGTPDNGQVAGETDDGANVPDGTPVTNDVKLNETVRIVGTSINPLEVVEDSRCPEGVQCIQAGTVRVRASVTARGDAQAQEVMFELGVPMTVGTDQITLVSVSPGTKAEAQIAPGDYVFNFTVVKNGGSEFFKG